MLSISQQSSGAYEPQLVLQDGSQVGIVEYLQGMNNEISGKPGSVVDVVHISDGSARPANTTSTFQYDAANPPGRLLYVPTLADLGYNNAEYSLQAIGIFHLRSSNPPQDVEVRVVNAAGAEVTGSLHSGTASTANSTDTVLKTPAFSLNEGAGYALDLRLTTPNGTDNASINSAHLLVQVVKN